MKASSIFFLQVDVLPKNQTTARFRYRPLTALYG